MQCPRVPVEGVAVCRVPVHPGPAPARLQQPGQADPQLQAGDPQPLIGHTWPVTVWNIENKQDEVFRIRLYSKNEIPYRDRARTESLKSSF